MDVLVNDVLVIGGGIIGLLSALELAQSGCKVTILDSQDFGQAASWAGGGILSPMYPWRYPSAVNQLARWGKSLYQTMQPNLLQATGIDIEINPSGMLILDEAEIENALNWATQDNDPQQTARLLTDTTLHAINPNVHLNASQAVWFEQLANIRNPRLLKALITYLKQHPLITMQPFTAIEKFKVANNKINALVDKNGKCWQADQYVLASGAWSGLLTEQLDWQIPIKPIQGQMILFKAPNDWLNSMLMQKGIYLIPRLDGHIVCGSSTDDVGFNTDVNTAIGQTLKRAAYDMLPALKEMPIVTAWAGLRPSVADGIPYIGQAPHLSNLWLNCGHFRNGLVMAPASALLLKQLMLDQPTIVDPSPYIPSNRININ